jgi:hypothetical protein
MVAAWCVDRSVMAFQNLSLRSVSQTTLKRDAAREICLTEHLPGGFMSVSIWQVWQRNAGSDTWQPMFTVVAGFQEAEPAVPELASDGLSLSDKRKSYVFDLSADKFTTNTHPDSVYKGTFRCSPPPGP